jgi:threonine synthase
MKYYSTNNKNVKVSLREAVLQGLASDNGLFMPERIPVLPKSFFNEISGMPFTEIAYQVAHALLGEDIDPSELRKIIRHTITFDAPLVQLEDNVFALELFHGPTMAFKDFGARFMSRVLGHFAQQQEREVFILVATSGDTGSAVANGFLNVPGTRVIVIYPSGKVSDIQEKQFTTLGENIVALEVSGTFDDCQRIVKQAFLDEDLRRKFFLTSANSINISRLIPQSFYYFYAYSKLAGRNTPVVFSVPSGNFGNLTAGLLARRMGLPVNHFIAATNANDVIPKYLSTKVFSPKPSLQTISNAMDVGNPSNFPRMLDLYGNEYNELIKDVTGYSFNDSDTRDAMSNVYGSSRYVLDPHGAVGYLGLKKYLSSNGKDLLGVFLATAHPGKFKDVVEESIQDKMAIPPGLAKFLQGKKQSIPLGNSYAEFKKTFLSL